MSQCETARETEQELKTSDTQIHVSTIKPSKQEGTIGRNRREVFSFSHILTSKCELN